MQKSESGITKANKRVLAPGSRGGKFYINAQGEVVYGDRMIGSVIGKTRSGKPIYSPHHPIYNSARLKTKEIEGISDYKERARANSEHNEQTRIDLGKKLGYSESLPISEIFSREVISLPVHPGLTEADIENIIDVIRSVK